MGAFKEGKPPSALHQLLLKTKEGGDDVDKEEDDAYAETSDGKRAEKGKSTFSIEHCRDGGDSSREPIADCGEYGKNGIEYCTVS